MPLSFLVDENVPFEIVEGLRRRDIKVVTLNENDLLSAPDIDILKYASDQYLVVYTPRHRFFEVALSRYRSLRDHRSSSNGIFDSEKSFADWS
jgi:predicted nuclease of predicted toxin-antitoxin system